jgi:hypothetical protein
MLFVVVDPFDGTFIEPIGCSLRRVITAPRAPAET